MPVVSAATLREREKEERTGIFAVGEIVDEKFEDDHTDTNKINLYYLVHWKNWPHSHDSWEPQENLTSSKDVLKAWAEKKLANTKGPARSKKKTVSPVRTLGNRRPLLADGEIEDGDDSYAKVESDLSSGSTGTGTVLVDKITQPLHTGDAEKEPIRTYSSLRSETGKYSSISSRLTPTSYVPSTVRAYTPRYIPPRDYYQVPDWTLEDYLSFIPFIVVGVVVIFGICSIFIVPPK